MCSIIHKREISNKKDITLCAEEQECACDIMTVWLVLRRNYNVGREIDSIVFVVVPVAVIVAVVVVIYK